MAGPRRPPVTMAEIARTAGVSKATVSRAFTRPDLLTSDTVARIHAIAEELGYVPNAAARALSTGRAGTVGIVVPDIANQFFPPIIRGAQVIAERAGLSVHLADTDESTDREYSVLHRMRGRTEGILLVSSRLADREIRELAEGNGPIVLVDRLLPGMPSVVIDPEPGVRAAVSHLAGLGHRRIVFLMGPTTSWNNRARLAILQRAASEHNIGVQTYRMNRTTYADGRRATEAVLRSGATAAVVHDDTIALGLMAELAHRGVRVPEQLSVMGADDVFAEAMHPPMTSITTDPDRAGRWGMQMLLRCLERPDERPADRNIPTALVVRRSTGPAPTGAGESSRAGESGGARDSAGGSTGVDA